MFSIKTGTAAASCRPDPIREKGVLKSPQAFQNPKISNNSSAETAQSSAAALPSASTAAAMAGAAAHSTEGAAAEAATAERAASKGAASAGATERPAAKAAAHGRTGRTPVVVPGRAGPVIAGAGAIARAVSGTEAGARRRRWAGTITPTG